MVQSHQLNSDSRAEYACRRYALDYDFQAEFASRTLRDAAPARAFGKEIRTDLVAVRAGMKFS
jgi:hypothetical protein